MTWTDDFHALKNNLAALMAGPVTRFSRGQRVIVPQRPRMYTASSP